MGWEGARCQRNLLPSCVLPSQDNIPIRSWALHAFHNEAARGRWAEPSGFRHGHIGPVPCECLQEWVAAPWLLERSRLQSMRQWSVHCISLADMVRPHGSASPNASASASTAFAHALAAPESIVWRSFSFAAVHDSLKAVQSPHLLVRPMDADHPRVASALAPLRSHAERIVALLANPKLLSTAVLTRDAPALLGPLSLSAATTTPPPLPLLPLSRCPCACGGRGWCEESGRGARCGCFVPGGLLPAEQGKLHGGPACESEMPRLASSGATRLGAIGPRPHWGPGCPTGCELHGACDWQGFCKCDLGFWGLDCALRLDRDRRPEVSRQVGGERWQARRGTAAGRPRVYVWDLPPQFRFGVDFASAFESKLLDRFRASAHRTADASSADVIVVPGPPLVVDGHRLLARLWNVRSRSPLWDAGGSANRTILVARHALCLLTERAAMDSFQLSYSDADREEWPALATAPHVVGVSAEWQQRRRGGGGTTAGIGGAAPVRRGGEKILCGLADPPPPGPLGTAAATADVGRMVTLAKGGDAGARRALRRLVGEATVWRRNSLGAPLLGGLFHGGYQEASDLEARGCALPADLRPDSASRRWLGLQFNGNTQLPVSFQRGVDIVLPQLLLVRTGGSHADQPSCDTMRATSPHSPAFERVALHRHRTTLLWFGGHHGHGGARKELFKRFGGDGRGGGSPPGFALVDSLAGGPRRDATNMSLSSVFCWVPRGQGQGDPTRHMVSIFHGCVPVFTLGKSGADDALPFEEMIPWGDLSLRVPVDRLESLPSVLWSAASDAARLGAMQRRIGCAWRRLFWSSLEGSCFGEAAHDGRDAFGTLMAILRQRLRVARRISAPVLLGGADGCSGVPKAVSSSEPPPGADPDLLRLRPAAA